MKKASILLVLLNVFISSPSQSVQEQGDSVVTVVRVVDSSKVFMQLDKHQEDALRSQAESMVYALLKKDYPSYVRSIHPTVVQMMGGEDKIIAYLKKSSKSMAIKKAVIGGYTRVARAGNELHTFIPQDLDIDIVTRKIKTRSHLFAVSKDEGKNWLFVDAATLTKDNIRIYFPNYNIALPVPEKMTPAYE